MLLTSLPFPKEEITPLADLQQRPLRLPKSLLKMDMFKTEGCIVLFLLKLYFIISNW